jgi:hypothetical protein
MQGAIRMITFGQALISVFFLVMALFSLPQELDGIFFLFNILAGISSAAFIIYTSANPVPGSEDTTLLYFYVLLSINCFTVVVAFLRCRLANSRRPQESKEIKSCSTNIITASSAHDNDIKETKDQVSLIKMKNTNKKVSATIKKNQ